MTCSKPSVASACSSQTPLGFTKRKARSCRRCSHLPQGLIAVLLLSLACVPQAAKAADFDCKFEVQGRRFDLSGLDDLYTHETRTEMPPSASKSIYAVSLCKPFKKRSDVPDRDQCPEGSRACLSVINEKEGEADRVVSIVPIATGDLDPTIAFKTGSKSTPDSLQIDLHGGQYLGKPRWAHLTLWCDMSQDTQESKKPTKWEYKRTETEGVLNVEWVTKDACALDGGNSPNKAREGSSIGRLLGDFILLLLILLALYFAAGAYYNYSQYGSRGWDLVPNRAFWADLPYVLRDIFRGTGRNSSGYSAL